MREVVIVDAIRTPIGRGHPEKGYYRATHPADLLATAYRAVVERSGIEPLKVDAALAGCVQQFGQQSMNIARTAWLQEGLPLETAAMTLDLQCGSAQQAVNLGATLIASGVHDVVIGAGVEHMGINSFAAAAQVQEEFGSPITPALLERYDIRGQGIGAELIAEAWGISRHDMEQLAVRSHRRAWQATEEGSFAREIVPVTTEGELHVRDQGIREDASLDALTRLKPAFKQDGRITAGTSSQISDGAAAVMLADRATAERLGLRPRARVVDQVTVGCDPVRMLEGPIPATRKILGRNGMGIGDIDRIEVNEAFASVVLAWEREHKPDMERVNVRGGAMALGHPLGSSGARLITTLLHILEDEDAETGLVTMCCGGGLGTGTLIQRL
ncbi:thiolase family protein [Streptomyces sp. NPDC059909]|uniref:thiolase family protein n=1 Tax=Streptomyces sp. NPDC059909 TaxID=3346998 RepID=UPI00365645AC